MPVDICRGFFYIIKVINKEYQMKKNLNDKLNEIVPAIAYFGSLIGGIVLFGYEFVTNTF